MRVEGAEGAGKHAPLLCIQALLQSQGSMALLANGHMTAHQAKQQLSALKSGVAATTRTTISNDQVGSASGAPGCWLLAVGGEGESPALHALGRCAAWGALALPGGSHVLGHALETQTDTCSVKCIDAYHMHGRSCDTCSRSDPRCEVGCTW